MNEGWYGSTPKRYRLSELIARMSPERRGEIDFGPPVGREFLAEGWRDVGDGGSSGIGDGGTQV